VRELIENNCGVGINADHGDGPRIILIGANLLGSFCGGPLMVLTWNADEADSADLCGNDFVWTFHG
jgi:hypothetical protein